MRFRTLGAIAAVALVLGCGDDRPPTSPGGFPPQANIVDGSTTGNEDFFFLPPLAPSPTGDDSFDDGAFNGSWNPIVEICELNTTVTPNVCKSGTTQTYTLANGVTVSGSEQAYSLMWKPPSTITMSESYRITVRLTAPDEDGEMQNYVLGSMDVKVITSGQHQNKKTGELITLNADRTLPIRFRIENGVLVAGDGNGGGPADYAEVRVTNAGGTFTTNTGFAGAFFPSGWLTGQVIDGVPVTEVILTIARVPVPDNDCHNTNGLLQFEGCYFFATDPILPLDFAQPVTVGVCTELPESDPRYDAQSMFRSGLEELEELPGAAAPFIKCTGFAGTAAPVIGSVGLLRRAGDRLEKLASLVGRALSPKPAYAIDAGRGGTTVKFSNFGWGIPLDIAIAGGNNQSGLAGTQLSQPLTVLVTGSHLHGGTDPHPVPIFGVPVTFATASGSGTMTVTTGSGTQNGLAWVLWTLDPTPGTQTITASINTVDHEEGDETLPRQYYPATKSVTFTATAIAVNTVISGTVTTDPGTGVVPVAGAVISVANPTGGPPLSTTSDASGNYTLVIPATTGGTVPISAILGGLGDNDTVVLNGEPQTVNFFLSPIIS